MKWMAPSLTGTLCPQAAPPASIDSTTAAALRAAVRNELDMRNPLVADGRGARLLATTMRRLGDGRKSAGGAQASRGGRRGSAVTSGTGVVARAAGVRAVEIELGHRPVVGLCAQRATGAALVAHFVTARIVPRLGVVRIRPRRRDVVGDSFHKLV